MDYRNADGSLSEMCGNGIRVFARHLVEEGLVDPVRADAGRHPRRGEGADRRTATWSPPTWARRRCSARPGRRGPASLAARHVDMGNPHAVAFVDSLDDAGPLLEPPDARRRDLPARRQRRVRRTPRRAARRDARARARLGGDPLLRHRRLRGDGARPRAGRRRSGRPPAEDVAYRVDVPGGTLTVTWTADDRVLLTGPAVIVARGPPPSERRLLCSEPWTSTEPAPSSRAARRASVRPPPASSPPRARSSSSPTCRPTRARPSPQEIGGVFAQVDVTDTDQIKAAVNAAAEIAPAARGRQLRRHRLGPAHHRPRRRVRLRPRPRRVQARSSRST